MAKHSAIEREITVAHNDGRRTLSTVKFPILDQSSELIAIGGIEHDITALKSAEREALAAKGGGGARQPGQIRIPGHHEP